MNFQELGSIEELIGGITVVSSVITVLPGIAGRLFNQ